MRPAPGETLMQQPLRERFEQRLPARQPGDPAYAQELVDAILAGARESAVSDVHLLPTADALEMCWRIDGVLQPIARFPSELAAKVVARLKVLAELLTYRTDIPQEGRLRAADDEVETRISSFPTLFGEKAVVRLFVGSGKYRRLDDLGLEPEVLGRLRLLLDQTGGVILLTGPAGSGKTTTIYACLREIQDKSAGRRSLVTLEDPIEVVVPGVAQSQVNPQVGFNMAAGLRSQLRQDPEVIMVGEIRDRETAETVFQASLTGHLVITTFHAGSSAAAVNRLCDMGIEPYLIRSGLLAVLCQRLMRRLCRCARSGPDVVAGNAETSVVAWTPEHATPATGGLQASGGDLRSEEWLGGETEPQRAKAGLSSHCVPVGCNECGGTGYSGRMLISEMLIPDEGDVDRGILSRRDTAELHRRALAAGMVDQRQRAWSAVAEGLTSVEEVYRVLGSGP